jgi:SsrA-binding protein
VGRVRSKGLTLVPLDIHLSDRGQAKVELGLARGKKSYDHRRDIAERDARRDLERDLADVRRGR